MMENGEFPADGGPTTLRTIAAGLQKALTDKYGSEALDG